MTVLAVFIDPQKMLIKTFLSWNVAKMLSEMCWRYITQDHIFLLAAKLLKTEAGQVFWLNVAPLFLTTLHARMAIYHFCQNKFVSWHDWVCDGWFIALEQLCADME
jgi:hypothetical protein